MSKLSTCLLKQSCGLRVIGIDVENCSIVDLSAFGSNLDAAGRQQLGRDGPVAVDKLK